MPTVSIPPDVRDVINRVDLNQLAEALAKIKVGDMLSKIKVVATGLTAAASFDITSAAFKAASVITGITLDTGENLPPIGSISSVRVTASGTAASVGVYVVGDAGATPLQTAAANTTPGVARLSDDGKTLTFANTVTAITFVYSAAPSGGADQLFVIGAP